MIGGWPSFWACFDAMAASLADVALPKDLQDATQV